MQIRKRIEKLEAMFNVRRQGTADLAGAQHIENAVGWLVELLRDDQIDDFERLLVRLHPPGLLSAEERARLGAYLDIANRAADLGPAMRPEPKPWSQTKAEMRERIHLSYAACRRQDGA